VEPSVNGRRWMPKTVDHLTCRACQGCIKEFEPDIVLRKIAGSEKRFYHVRCAREPGRIVASEGDGVWSLTCRHVFWNMEGGAA
jgi:hypothetical protein